MNNQNQKLLERIQKLFKLAEGNENDHEAQSALLAAQKLMVENGIEQSEIERLSNKQIPREVVHENITNGERLFWWKRSLARIIATNFCCKSYILRSTNDNGGLIFLGLKEDVELAETVYTFAKDAIVYGTSRYLADFKKNHRNQAYTGHKNDYMTGWLSGLSAQYEEQVKKNNWGLVLVTDSLVLRAYEDLKLRTVQTSPRYTANNQNAMLIGYQHGKAFNGISKRIDES
ncbi:MAG: DUF2786 domain-containing protein [Desulfosporosinus sp.]|nr:DUF2786 domain-containing protein [Desulfosporosinus sp.]